MNIPHKISENDNHQIAERLQDTTGYLIKTTVANDRENHASFQIIGNHCQANDTGYLGGNFILR